MVIIMVIKTNNVSINVYLSHSEITNVDKYWRKKYLHVANRANITREYNSYIIYINLVNVK